MEALEQRQADEGLPVDELDRRHARRAVHPVGQLLRLLHAHQLDGRALRPRRPDEVHPGHGVQDGQSADLGLG